MLLLLAGTGEARELAKTLAEGNVAAVASLSGATREPASLALPTRSGGFGGDLGFERYLTRHKISAVLDATHPFASRISTRTARICQRFGMPYLQVLRPPWVAQQGDRWHMVAREEDVAACIPEQAVVFLATGRQTLDRFKNLAGRRLICRQIDPPKRAFPFPGGQFLLGRPPFSLADEVALFSRLGVDWLVVKNAGGEGARAKLHAARNLGIAVAMIARPDQPACETVTTVAAAMGWVGRL